MISYLTTSLINPGIPNRDYYSKYFSSNNPDIPTSNLVKCSKCNIVVPKYFRISHCNIYFYINISNFLLYIIIID